MTKFVFALALLVPMQQPTLFVFHSAFWMNLHHYLQALGRASEPLVEDLPATATAAERAQWASAVEFYRTRYGRRSLLFDESLLEIKQTLIAADDAALSPTVAAKLTPEHRQVLERVAPIYRRHVWPEHDRRNHQYIESLQPLIRQYGQAIADRLARSYDSRWPEGGLRVDMVRDAGPPGNAYTTNVPHPTHITIGADFLGHTSLESVFHEASHHWDQQLMTVVQDAARRAETKAPPDLWHALLFFNTGQITTDALAAAGVRDYVQMMVKQPIFARPGWHDAISRHWPLFLAGQISRDEAVLRVLRDLQGLK